MPAWATGGRSIYAQDITNIYQTDLDVKTVAQWKISEGGEQRHVSYGLSPLTSSRVSKAAWHWQERLSPFTFDFSP